MFDAQISLATALHAQPGTYALLVGSGASTGAGVPTGWGVVKSLVAQAALAAGQQNVASIDPELWWAEHGDGEPLGYSGLLACLASTPAARRALLARFFEATAEEREQGQKVPGPAHQAIAALVDRGVIRVILTTNFDRLIESALEARGISPQVIDSPQAIIGMEPLVHARCTVVKLHGDYARIDQLNTTEELSKYDDSTQALLDRILDEYGLIINGWSADWDTALVAAIKGTRTRRYPLFWSTYGELGHAATRLVAQHRAHVITDAAADNFFPGLVARLETLDKLTNAPMSKAMAITHLKRALPDPTKHIELRDLFDKEVSGIRDLIASRSQMPPNGTVPVYQAEFDRIRAQCDTLLHLLAHGVYFDRYRQHTDLWVWVVERLMRFRPWPNGQYNEAWVCLNHLPALLALRAASMASVGSGRDDVMIRLHREPSWREQFGEQKEVPAMDALAANRILDGHGINAFSRWDGAAWTYPHSHLLKEELRPALLPLLGDEKSYVETFHRTEYRTALISRLFGAYGGLEVGEFIGEHPWDGGAAFLEQDFRNRANREVWEWEPVADGEQDKFSDTLTDLTETLRDHRSWGS